MILLTDPWNQCYLMTTYCDLLGLINDGKHIRWENVLTSIDISGVLEEDIMVAENGCNLDVTIAQWFDELCVEPSKCFVVDENTIVEYVTKT